jgi:putative phage-type endonuclease
VGNAGGGYLNAQIRVLWFEILVDHAQKRVDVIELYLPIKNHRRQNRINLCEYEVPEGVVCFYDRHVTTKPNTYERTFFRIDGGQFHNLGDDVQNDFFTRFLGEYGDYDTCSGPSQEEVAEKRKRSAELERLGPGVHVIVRRRSDAVAEDAAGTMVSSSVLAIPKPMEKTKLRSSPFTIVKLLQGTLEWLGWRNEGIGASDAPGIMGENPWKTAAEILSEKRGRARESEQNAVMARGTALEPEARQAYISRSGKLMQPACLQSNAYDWLRASVDGITPNHDAVVEIKCGESVYRKTSACGRVPDYYYGQLQHILAVTGLQSIDFWCYLPGRSPVLVATERDDSYIARLLEVEFQFWTKVLRTE